MSLGNNCGVLFLKKKKEVTPSHPKVGRTENIQVPIQVMTSPLDMVLGACYSLHPFVSLVQLKVV